MDKAQLLHDSLTVDIITSVQQDTFNHLTPTYFPDSLRVATLHIITRRDVSLLGVVRPTFSPARRGDKLPIARNTPLQPLPLTVAAAPRAASPS